MSHLCIHHNSITVADAIMAIPPVRQHNSNNSNSNSNSNCIIRGRALQFAIFGSAIFALAVLTITSSLSRQDFPLDHNVHDTYDGLHVKIQRHPMDTNWQGRNGEDADSSAIPSARKSNGDHHQMEQNDRNDDEIVIGNDMNADHDRPNLSTTRTMTEFRKGKSFFDRHCQLGGGDDDDDDGHDQDDQDAFSNWWPDNGADDWRTRTPHFLLIGAKKAGTTSLSSWLLKHPNIVRPSKKELLYFLPSQQEKKQQTMYDNVTRKYKVNKIRADLYNQGFNVARLKENEEMITGEATPGYLLFSTLSRIPILCTMPWVKLLVTLRSPVRRTFSNYNFLLEVQRKWNAKGARRNDTTLPPFPTFDDFIWADIRLLKIAGVLRDGVVSDDFFGSQEERIAWTTYQGMVGRTEAPVGRSLYILQLQEWFSALQELGRDPRSEVLVVRNEEMSRHPNAVLQKILRWLKLPAFAPPSFRSLMVTTYRSAPMSNETHAMLEDLFRPYNQRLFDLLGWNSSVWDESNDPGMAMVDYDDDEEEEEDANSTALEHIYDPPSHDQVKGQKFTDRWCILDRVSWFPPPDKIWQLRAPYFMLPGAKKSGTTSVAAYLMQHPLIEKARTKELQFFLNKNFLPNYANDENKTLVREARRHIHTVDYHSGVLKRNQSLMSFDGTPGYLFDGPATIRRILCVAPWIKVVIVLRNPVDRAFSNWAFAMWRNRVTNVIPFETYMAQDMQALTRSGVLNASSPEEEDKAWTSYRTIRNEGSIGRSLYEIQLRQWFQALEDIGRDPKTQVHILRSDDLKNDIQGTMSKVHDFLGIPHAPVLTEKEMVVTNYSEPMKNQTREKLEKFYDPYNQRLYKLLVSYGFGEDWNGYWDQK